MLHHHAEKNVPIRHRLAIGIREIELKLTIGIFMIAGLHVPAEIIHVPYNLVHEIQVLKEPE